MVQRVIKIPKHGGPDGQGLQPQVFDQLLELLNNQIVSDIEAQDAIDLCFNVSTQIEWNDTYREELLIRYRKL